MKTVKINLSKSYFSRWEMLKISSTGKKSIVGRIKKEKNSTILTVTRFNYSKFNWVNALKLWYIKRLFLLGDFFIKLAFRFKCT